MNEPYFEFVNEITVNQFAKFIDHTLLKPDANYKTLDKYIEDTRRFGFALLMLPLSLIRRAREIAGNTIELGVVVGFPLGNTSTTIKVAEVIEAAQFRVSDVDMVMNINAFKSGDYKAVFEDINSVVNAARKNGVKTVKVIIETGLLTDEEKIKATQLALESGADYVKTCTGFLGGVATVHDVKFLKKASQGKLGVKASGGIRHALDAISMIIAGANRIGTSSGDKIIEEYLRLKELW